MDEREVCRMPVFSEWEGNVPRRSVLDIVWPTRWFMSCGCPLAAVPAYLFHQAEPETWRRIIHAIQHRRMRTIRSDDIIDRRVTDSQSSIWLTFDDGRSSVWSVAFPLMRRFGLQFTIFLTPHFIVDSDKCGPTIEDGCSSQELAARDLSDVPWLTWGEVRAMHESGLVDVQSHTLHHAAVWRSDQIIRNVPQGTTWRMPGRSPMLLRREDEDILCDRIEAGDVLRPLGPALAVRRRYIEASVPSHSGSWEDDVARRRRFNADLTDARRMIEQRLRQVRIRSIAPPWATMHDEFPQAARETGHELIVLGYPFDRSWRQRSVLPVYPRLKGDAVWLHLKDPMRGLWLWHQSRQEVKRLVAAGGVA